MHLIPFSAHKRTTLHWSRRICRLYWQDVSQNFSWLRRSLSEARTWSTARYLMSPEILSIPLRWKAWPEIWVSASYVLSRIFSKTFHKNFNQYLNDARLGYACQRLENTNDTITELCLDSGFKSLRTFNRAFKEKFKTSPSEYRKTFVRNWNMMWCQEIGIWYDCRAHDPMIYWWDGKSEHINMTRQYMQRRYWNIWSITWYRKESSWSSRK